jgi:serine/threonine protein kinase
MKRESRALSQEVENNEKSMAVSEEMDYEQSFQDSEDEGENDIVLIEEEYKSMLDEPSIKPNEITRNDFIFLKLLGSGAHAKVYLARKTDTSQLYAIKVLDKKELNQKKQVNGTKVERKILVRKYP